MKHWFKLIFLPCSFLMLLASCSPVTKENTDWPVYGGSNEKTHYIENSDINPSNLNRLKKVWEYNTGDATKGTQIQTNPLILDSIVYGISPQLKLFALSIKSGQALWTFDPFNQNLGQSQDKFQFSMNVSRGISHYINKKGRSILYYGVGSYLIAVDAATGNLYKPFAEQGILDLHIGLGERAKDLYVAATSPGMVYNNLIIIGSRVNEALPAAPGNIRAFSAETGALVWNFHTIPQPGETGYDSWEDKDAWKWAGGANAWSSFSLDQERGILYAPTGSASYDFYGANRLGNNLFANSILAINATTGKLLWHYQTIHHDVWDRDLPTPPVLFTYNKEGEKIPALAQVTKSGYVFILNRITGTPIYEIKEEKVPTNTPLLGEKLSPTQPIPSFFSPFSRQTFNENELNPFLGEEENEKLLAQFRSLRKDHVFAPPSQEGTLIFPGYDGGAEWGGPALDLENQWLYVNTNEMPWILTMVPFSKKDGLQDVEQLYSLNCISCHGSNFKGSENVASLIGIKDRLSTLEIETIITNGRRMMPAFKHLEEKNIRKLTNYLMELTPGSKIKTALQLNPETYKSTGYHKFLTKDGYPAINPPWGTLTALNLNSGDIEWKFPLGNSPIGIAKGVLTGTENYGGPLVTKSGLVFIAATPDKKIRAFDKTSGEILWEADLPYAGFATPSLVTHENRSYLIIACGGGKLNVSSGDAYVAFALE